MNNKTSYEIRRKVGETKPLRVTLHKTSTNDGQPEILTDKTIEMRLEGSSSTVIDGTLRLGDAGVYFDISTQVVTTNSWTYEIFAGESAGDMTVVLFGSFIVT